MQAALLAAAAFCSRPVPQHQQLVASSSRSVITMSGYGGRSAASSHSGGSGRGRSFSRGRSGGRGRGRTGERARGGRGGGRSRGRGGYDWTKHLPPDHPMRRGLGPDPSPRNRYGGRGHGGNEGCNDPERRVVTGSRIYADDEAWGLARSETEDDIIEAEYAAYYQRREARRKEQSERNQKEFDRITAHACKRQEGKFSKASSTALDTSKFDDEEESVSTAALAARRAVLAMSEEEKEAALARHEERQAMRRHAIDLKPQGLDLNPIIRKELEKAVDKVQSARDNNKLPSACCSERIKKRIRSSGRSSSIGMNSSYFKVKESSNHYCAKTYKGIVSNRMKTRAYQSLLEQRRKLPAYQMSTTIADTILNPKVSTAIISGLTGCGKR